ncbi:hypothetical protein ACF0H5_013534 [Mactra antiquata]
MNLGHKEKSLEENHQSCVDRPFKKARFAWQIKGYMNPAKRECVPVPCTSETIHSKLSFHEEQNATNIDNSCSEITTRCNASHGLYPESAFVQEKCDNISESSIDNKINQYEKVNDNGITVLHEKNCYKRKGDPISPLNGTDSDAKRLKLESFNSSVQSIPYTLSNESPNNNEEIISDLTSYMWQKREMGFAIVDNVCNETLEVMGLSPDPKVNLLAKARLALENYSIETAIKSQGLFANTPKQTEASKDMDVIVDEYEFNDNSIDQCQENNHLINITVECKPDYLRCRSPVNDRQLIHESNNYTDIESNRYVSSHKHDKFLTCGKEPPDQFTDTMTSESLSTCNIMEHSGFTDTSNNVKNSDMVIDLGVSSAIINNGLTYGSV